MSSLQIGRKCIKVTGRKAGETVTITKIIDRNFVEVKDSKDKSKRCNVMHLEPI